MAFTPAHIAQVHGNARSRRLDPQDLIRIRKLYLDKRFKNCITACEELLQSPHPTPATPTFRHNTSSTDLHPVHQAFLIFHQAISHECLGINAHKYSSNKINFLTSAKDQFQAALSVLPQPFASEGDGTYQTPQTESPDTQRIGTDSDASCYSNDTPLPQRITSETPTFRISDVTRSPSEESFDSTTSGTTVSATYTVVDFDKYSPRPSINEKNMQFYQQTPSGDWNPSPSESVEYLDDSSSEDRHEDDRVVTWLPRSMRSLNLAAHTLGSDSDDDTSEGDAEQILPSRVTPILGPTERLQVPMPKDASHTSRLSASLSSQDMLCPNLVPPPLFSKTKTLPKTGFGETDEPNIAPRPLPRTPHSHLTHLTLLPARKTAVQTLISKFEGKLPLPDTPSSNATMPTPTLVSTRTPGPTPITTRFDMIRNASYPSPAQTHLEEYLTSRSLAQYNSNLATFRTCLLFAYEQIVDMLEAAQAIQKKHHEDKHASALEGDDTGMPKNRLASLWLLSTPGKPSGSRPHIPGNCNSGSVTRAKMLGRSASLRGRKKLPLRKRIEESEEKRAERIEKLRQNGFRVQKEHHGWKGEEYYEGFRRKVEIDLVA